VPIKCHSYSGNSGAVGNIFPPWKRGDPEPHPNPIPAHKRMKTDIHINLSRTNLDGTDDTKVVSNANLNRETRAHFPTPPPMPEHKLKYEMNPIDGDLSVTEKKDDGSYSFR
jgi:hypothetical protein